MSLRKGGPRSKPQRHQNVTKFRNDLHDNSKLIKSLNTMEITGVCQRCRDQIKWRIDYKKYKPLGAPKKCVKCLQKIVKRAYTVACEPCGENLKICLKCLESKELVGKSTLSQVEENRQRQELNAEMKLLSERQRRALERQIANGGCEGKDPDELHSSVSLSQSDGDSENYTELEKKLEPLEITGDKDVLLTKQNQDLSD